MKTSKQSNFVKCLTFLCFNFIVCQIIAQESWQTIGNNVDSTSFIGTINNEPLILKSNNTEKIVVYDSIIFNGLSVFDSVKIEHGYLKVDSIRTRVIHVGDSSLVIGSLTGAGGSVAATNNFILSNDGAPIILGRVISGTFSSAIEVGIGTTTPLGKLGIENGTGYEIYGSGADNTNIFAEMNLVLLSGTNSELHFGTDNVKQI